MPHTLIIAEIGVNHNGCLKTAEELVRAAALAGADIVKIQTFIADCLTTPEAPKAPYQKQTDPAEENQLDMLRKLELTPAMHEALIQHCRQNNIKFMSAPFDLESVKLLTKLQLDTFKIPSGEITNAPYLRAIGALNKNVIMSTGMSTLREVAEALNELIKAGTDAGKITLLHCTTEYPAPFEEVNLKAMETMRKAFPNIAGVGYSDHTTGITVPIAAAALGAAIIEKHFTLDKTMAGPDHKASLEPHEFKAMCLGIRQVELCMGDGDKAPTASELPNKEVARKSIVAARDIARGEVFTENNITAKRPGVGLSPMKWDDIIGTKANRSYKAGELI